MASYMLQVWYPAGAEPPDAAALEVISADVEQVHRELRDAGAWVFGAGLHDPSTATVVDARGERVLTTDGPFAETKEVLGGFSVVQVPDLDAAMAWAERLSRATTCPIEVRPMHTGTGS